MKLKYRIELIIKILLILIFVPVGGISLAATVYSNTTTSNTTLNTYQPFTSTTQPNLSLGYDWNYETSVCELQNNNRNQNEILTKNSRVFCLFKTAFVKESYASYAFDTYYNNPSINGAPSELFLWNLYNFHTIYADLKSVCSFNLNGDTYTRLCDSGDVCQTYNIAYAMSFLGIGETKKSDVENAIDECIAKTGSTALYNANKAYVAAAKIKQSHPMQNIEVKADTSGSKIVGSKTSEDGNFAVVGPFHISDHPYAWSEYMSSYTGRAMPVGVSSYSIMGLTNCKITIKDDKGEEKTLSSYDKQFTICYNENGYVGSPKNTNYVSASGSSYISTPTEYTEYKVPYPNNDFYVKIPKSEIGEGYQMTKLEFTAVDTISDGNGNYLTSSVQIDKYSWNNGSKPKHESLKCSKCGKTFPKVAKKCDGTMAANTDDDYDYYNGAPHDCGKWKCNIDGTKHTSSSSEFVLKEKAVYSNSNWSRGKKDGYSIWYKCIKTNSPIFEDVYKHITGEDFVSAKNTITKIKAGTLKTSCSKSDCCWKSLSDEKNKKETVGCKGEIIVAAPEKGLEKADGLSVYIGVKYFKTDYTTINER